MAGAGVAAGTWGWGSSSAWGPRAMGAAGANLRKSVTVPRPAGVLGVGCVYGQAHTIAQDHDNDEPARGSGGCAGGGCQDMRQGAGWERSHQEGGAVGTLALRAGDHRRDEVYVQSGVARLGPSVIGLRIAKRKTGQAGQVCV